MKPDYFTANTNVLEIKLLKTEENSVLLCKLTVLFRQKNTATILGNRAWYFIDF